VDFCKAFLSWCDNPPEDQFLLISCAKLDKKSMSKPWYKLLAKLGVHVEIWPVDTKNLPGWLAQRARKKGLNLDADALNVLAERVEGNLLAAQQEVERLSLLYANQDTISAAMMREYVGDNSRFDTFELLEASFAGDAKRLTRILTGLRHEGEAVAKINGLLTYELRNLTKMAWDCEQGEMPAQVMQKYYVWGNKKDGYGKSLRRYPLNVWQRILARCLELDKMIKGQQKGDAWTAMESLLLQISGNGLWKAR
ncbi:MAG: DNA polymerase III subunit delta, partial [Gammaproteobacteria bacterium]|nr:DNA polymerase III subunit delta [Gammaproteobacteria bacterium]